MGSDYTQLRSDLTIKNSEVNFFYSDFRKTKMFMFIIIKLKTIFSSLIFLEICSDIE